MKGVAGNSQAKLCLNLFWSILFVSFENETLWTFCESKLMNVIHFPISDKTNHCIRRDEAERLLQGILELNKFLRWHRSVYKKQEYWLGRFNTLVCFRENVLQSGIVLHQLKRQRLLRDITCVMRREVVSILTDGTRPSLKFEVNRTVRVQNGVARLAKNRRVLDWGKAF